MSSNLFLSVDLTPASNHPKRRIWQEAITTLFLTSPECGIPKEQPMHYAQARDTEFPPYLLNFTGMPGERHVENLKVIFPEAYWILKLTTW